MNNEKKETLNNILNDIREFNDNSDILMSEQQSNEELLYILNKYIEDAEDDEEFLTDYFDSDAIDLIRDAENGMYN